MKPTKEKFSFGRMLMWVAGTLIAGAFALNTVAKKTNLLDSYEKIEIKTEKGTEEIKIPFYNLLKLHPGRCSAYARKVAEDVFSKEYSFSKAWDRRYNDKLICEVEKNEDLKLLAENRILKPGMIVGVYVPESDYLNEIDANGCKVKYTHNMIYLGENKNNNLIFAEQFRAKTGIRTLEEISKNNLQIKEIIDVKEKK